MNTDALEEEKNNEKNGIRKPEYNDWQKEVMKIQYEKLANDWRAFNNLIWAVPTVAVAIMSGMLVAAYHEEFSVFPQVRIAILSLGSLFLFALTIEVIKKRISYECDNILVTGYRSRRLWTGREISISFRN